MSNWTGSSRVPRVLQNVFDNFKMQYPEYGDVGLSEPQFDNDPLFPPCVVLLNGEPLEDCFVRLDNLSDNVVPGTYEADVQARNLDYIAYQLSLKALSDHEILF